MTDFPFSDPFVAGGSRSAPIRILVPGTGIGKRFEVQWVIGTGASTAVYAAFDRVEKRDVALKVVRVDRMSPSALSRLKREVLAARESGSERLVQVFEIELAGEALTLCMERVAGESLGERLRSGPLAISEAVRIATGVLEALRDLHRLEIVHRDVKPGNVLLTDEGSVKLTDFGLERRWEREGMRFHETDGLPGTIEYLAPEQALGGHVDARSDLYSFGILLYEMLAGEVPLREVSSIGTVLAHLKRDAPDVRCLRPDAPEWLARLVGSLLVKNPAFRYGSAEAVLADLNAHQMRLRLPRRVPTSLMRSIAVAGALALAFLAWRSFSTPRFHRLVVDARNGARAVDLEGRLLWSQPDVNRVDYAEAIRTSGGVAQHVAAFLARGHDTDPDFTHTLVLLDAGSGRVERGVFLPDPAASFPGTSNTFRVTGMRAVDLRGDGREDLMITYAHSPPGPGYSILYEPRTDEAHVVFVSTGPQRFVGAVDVFGDGNKEFLFAGINPRFGGRTGIAAVRRPVRRRGEFDRPESPWASTPDRDAANGTLTGLVWYALTDGAETDGSVAIDEARRFIEVERQDRGRTLLDPGGFFRIDRSENPLALRAAARERAYEHLRQATLWSAAEAGQAELSEMDLALKEAELAGDRALLEWAVRRRGAALFASESGAEAERIFSTLSQRPELADVASFDAARGEHLRGDLDAAVSSYRRGLRVRPRTHGDEASLEALEGLVLALGEKERWDEAAEEIERSALVVPGQSAFRSALRRYAGWRSGRGAKEAESFDPSESDLHRYWNLELRAARGERAEHLATDVRLEYSRSSTTRGLLLSLHGQLFEALGREPEALAFSRRAYGVIAGLRRTEIWARAHYGLVARRYAELLRRSGRKREAQLVQREAAAFGSGHTVPAPFPVLPP